MACAVKKCDEAGLMIISGRWFCAGHIIEWDKRVKTNVLQIFGDELKDE